MGQSLGSEERQSKPKAIKPPPPSLRDLSKNKPPLHPPERIYQQQKSALNPLKPLHRYLFRLSESNLRRQVAKRGEAILWDFPKEISLVNDQTLRQFARETNSSKKIQKLYINLSKENNVDFSVKGLSYLGHCLKNLTCLKSLKLNVTTREKITNMTLYNLSEGLKRLVFLQDLDITFSDSDPIKEACLSHLSQALKRLRNLQNLTIALMWYNEITQKGLRTLLEGFKRLVFLKGLNLNLGFVKNSPKEMLNLTRSFQRLRCLQTLDLTFLTSNNPEAIEAKNLGEALQNLTSLENLHLRLGDLLQINDQGMKNLARGFEELTSLKKIFIAFSTCSQVTEASPHLTDTSLQYLEESFKNLSSLEKISISFGRHHPLTLNGVAQFRENLRQLSSVKSLQILSRHTKFKIRRSNNPQ